MIVMTVACTIKLQFAAYLTIQAKAEANLALAFDRIVNYKRNLKLTFMVVNYDGETFIVQALGIDVTKPFRRNLRVYRCKSYDFDCDDANMFCNLLTKSFLTFAT
jgi:hypothetical protein